MEHQIIMIELTQLQISGLTKVHQISDNKVQMKMLLEELKHLNYNREI